MKEPLRFPLSEVKENGELTVKVSVPNDLFPDALSEGALVGPVVVEGTIRAVEDDAVFEGSARGSWKFECTRCLTPVEGTWAEACDQTAPLASGSMDLTEEVRQSIGLAQPMKMFCKPDCKGLCPTCRADLNRKDCGHPPPVAEEPRTMKPRLTPRPKKG
ncbi:MAG: DUF177 domain-containing protein [Elusimicrobia bacterium]|nr:DUF177 domain-containing protein [Elusimicrobiota bacterium]